MSLTVKIEIVTDNSKKSSIGVPALVISAYELPEDMEARVNGAISAGKSLETLAHPTKVYKVTDNQSESVVALATGTADERGYWKYFRGIVEYLGLEITNNLHSHQSP